MGPGALFCNADILFDEKTAQRHRQLSVNMQNSYRIGGPEYIATLLQLTVNVKKNLLISNFDKNTELMRFRIKIKI